MESPESFGKGPEAVKNANEVAKIVNAELSSQSARIKNILGSKAKKRKNSKGRPLFSAVLAEFKKERVPELAWSKNYKKVQMQRIAKFEQYGGNEVYENTDVLFFRDMVNELFSGASRRTAISLLRTIDAWAVGNGRRKGSNAAKDILPPAKAKRKRQRINDFNDFKTIRANGEQWEKDVLDFALVTLQPREVICSLDIYKHIKKEDDRTYLRFQRGKTGVYIEIEIGESLLPLINRRRKEALKLGTHRLFCRPAREANKSVNIKPDNLTRRITKLIKDSGLYETNHPTLHEVRSLGGRMMEEAGFPTQLIQDLYGHKKSSTTEIYLNPDKPKYKKAKTVLELDRGN
jgi:site-specific recombinase XerC